MARARKVKGIRPGKSLRRNAQRVIEVRLEEMLSWRWALDDASQVAGLHNMRIAAKRLRYALEMFDICFPHTKSLLKTLEGIQEDLGTIHDFDVLTDVLRERLNRASSGLEQEALSVMRIEDSPANKSNRLRALLYAQARNPRRLGLLGLLGDKMAERERRFEWFRRRWAGDRLDEFARQVRDTIADQPEVEDSPPPLPEKQPEEAAVNGVIVGQS
ncbi:MAG TPA: CHAD domain-containing protein [Chloroflexota bacterium]